MEKMQEALVAFSNLGEEEQKKRADELRWKYIDLESELSKECRNDKELDKKVEELYHIKWLQTTCVKERMFVLDETDTSRESSDKDKEYFEACKWLWENKEDVQADLQDKMKKLQTGRFVFSRKQKIAKLENLMKHVRDDLELYETYIKLSKKLEYYEQKPDYVNDLKKSVDEAVILKTREYVDKILVENPDIICIKHQTNSSHVYNKYLARILNDKRKEVVDSLTKQDGKEINSERFV